MPYSVVLDMIFHKSLLPRLTLLLNVLRIKDIKVLNFMDRLNIARLSSFGLRLDRYLKLWAARLLTNLWRCH
jgi:hypothetical protein